MTQFLSRLLLSFVLWGSIERCAEAVAVDSAGLAVFWSLLAVAAAVFFALDSWGSE